MTNIELGNAELIMPFRNFSGKESKYNAKGSRNFAVYIPEELAEQLRADGWNVKVTNPGNSDYEQRPYINVAVKFEYRPPEIYVGTSPDRMRQMTEETVGELDWADIENVDLVIRPRPYDINGKSGVKAYLAKMYVIIQKSNFDDKYKMEGERPVEDEIF